MTTISKKNIICLSGWGQRYDALSSIFDCDLFQNFQVKHYNYQKFVNLDNFFDDFSDQFSKIEIDALVGWSLGGQLACRLIASKIVNPKKLILIAPPFQFVKDSKISAGMPEVKYQEFLQNFQNSPDSTLKKFTILAILNDKNGKKIINDLDLSSDNANSQIFWLNELGKFSSFELDFSDFPSTLYFHGLGDMIVHFKQKKYFQERIENFKEILLSDCGHAPHLSKKDLMQKEIINFLQDI